MSLGMEHSKDTYEINCCCSLLAIILPVSNYYGSTFILQPVPFSYLLFMRSWGSKVFPPRKN